MNPREAWLKERRTGIGSSDAAAILGLDPHRSPLSVYASKVAVLDEGAESGASTAGRYLQPVVARWFAEETGYVLEGTDPYAIQRRRDIPYLLASLDDRIVGKGEERYDPPARAPLEVKTTSLRNEGLWEDGPPQRVLAQVAHQMLVTGLSWAYVAVLIGGQDLRHFRVDRSARFEAAMLRAYERFWRLVETRTPPEPDATEAAAEAVRLLYPACEPGKTVTLPPEFVQVDARLVELKAQLAEAEAEKRALESRLRLAIGDAEAGRIPGGATYTLKAVTTPERTQLVKASTYRALRRKETA